ncbi:uncharacterized protein [Physcomitrium patens]|uniref:uncharacterized protein n=1 Tax=Physcomitrium patens TaxID=3218 RepID=UPI003CCD698D
MREGRALPERLRAVVELGIRIQRAEREFVTNSAIVVDLASRFCVLVRKLCAAQIRIRRSSLGEGAADVAALFSRGRASESEREREPQGIVISSWFCEEAGLYKQQQHHHQVQGVAEIEGFGVLTMIISLVVRRRIYARWSFCMEIFLAEIVC